MSDSQDNITGEILSKRRINKRVCHVAYTLNNAQPVACTIIGDQPMFYMDYESGYAEEEFLSVEDIAFLEKEVSKLKKEIDQFDQFTNFLNTDEDQKFQDILVNSENYMTQAAYNHQDLQKAALKQKILSILEKSRLAKAYIDYALEHKVSLQISDQVESAFYDRKAGMILVNPNLEIDEIVLLAAREYRRHWQHRQGALISPLVFQPDNAVLLNRLQVADLSTSMVRIAWELQLGGHKEIWQRLENSPMADLARAFAHEAFLDFRTINNGVANAAVLEAWFLSERCKNEDKTLIQQMLSDSRGIVFNSGEMARSVTVEMIAALGSMPFGKNYLAQHAMTILDDPIFNDVRDRSNANFLWFIKFERSFRDSEHELQNGEISLFGRNSGRSHSPQFGSDYAQQKTADILAFTAKADSAKEAGMAQNADLGSQKRRGRKRKGSAQATAAAEDSGEKIVYLRRWSSEQG
ncbi:MAG: DUF6782 family putative metallopeptidase [Alphaproteobacteria bacterium]